MSWIGEGEAPVYLFFGPEPYLVQQAARALREKIQPRCAPASMNVTAVRATDGGAEEALMAADTLPMMAERRLVMVGAMEAASDRFFEAFERYLERANPTTSLLVYGERFPKVRKGGKNWGSRLPRRVEKAGGVVQKWKDGDARPEQILRQEATRRGHVLASAEARLLVALVGPDVTRLLQELEKVCLSVPEGAALRAENITAAVSLVAEAEIWDLTSAIATRDADAALRTTHRLLEAGEAPHRLLAMILWQSRTALQYAEGRRQGESAHQLKRSLRLRQAVADGVERALRARTLLPAAEWLEAIEGAHMNMHRSRAGDRRVLEGLVLKLCVG